MYFYGIDPYFLMLVLPAFIFAMWAQANVNSTFNKYSRMPTGGRMTGADAARAILNFNGLQDVTVNMVDGRLSDHYDPRTRTVNLSRNVYSAATVAAVGVAAHECGHAIQHANGYVPLRLRNAIIPATQIGSTLAMPLFFIGLIFSFPSLMNAGILLFAIVTLFQLITLPVEYNASSRAANVLADSGMVSREEEAGVRRVLSAAALTYVAALAVSLANLLRLLALAGGRRGGRN